MDNAQVAEFLLAKGALLEIYIAAMLGRESELKRRLDDDAKNVNAIGPTRFPWPGRIVGNLRYLGEPWVQ